MIDTDLIVRRMAELPSFPRAVSAILAALEDDRHLSQLVRHLQHDPVISARVLAMANRPRAHALREPVTDLYTAASLIGLNRIREIALSAGVKQFIFLANGGRLFWEHSLAVGVCAQEIARDLRLDPDLALVTGLLHDIGSLWLGSFLPEAFAALSDASTGTGVRRWRRERDTFGMDHARIGALMVRHWDLPEPMCLAIEGHHHPGPDAAQPLGLALCLAEMICNGLDLPYRADNAIDDPGPAVWALLDPVGPLDLPDLIGRADARYRHELALLG